MIPPGVVGDRVRQLQTLTENPAASEQPSVSPEQVRKSITFD